MESVNITLLNPKAKRILQDLAELNLIAIHEAGKSKKDVIAWLGEMRNRHSNTPSLSEITKEVEALRKKRYAKK